ncbi:MAG: type II secretion system protein F [Gordonia sp. (in: high G+C Gram-positive bacteria)]
MTALIPLALAIAVLWWPASRVEHRIGELIDRRRSPRRRDIRWLLGAAAPTVAFFAGGVAGAVSAVIVVGVVWWRIRRRAGLVTTDRIRDDLLTALALMIAELSVGSPPARACAAAADEIASRAGTSPEVIDGLLVLAGRAELGGDVRLDADGPDGTGAAISMSQPWQRIAIAWHTADRYGVPMAELLAAVRDDLHARRAFAERTRAGLAGPRATATVLAGLPLLGIGLGQATGARPVQVLLGGGLGGILLVVGTALAAAGLVWTEHITDRVVR